MHVHDSIDKINLSSYYSQDWCLCTRASGASAARFDRPARQATEPRAKQEAMSALCHGLMVDSTFEQSENFAITR